VNPVTIEVPLQQVTEGKLAKKKKKLKLKIIVNIVHPSLLVFENSAVRKPPID